MNPYGYDLWGHELEAEHDAAVMRGETGARRMIYRIYVLLRGRWEPTDSMADAAWKLDHDLMNWQGLYGISRVRLVEE